MKTKHTPTAKALKATTTNIVALSRTSSDLPLAVLTFTLGAIDNSDNQRVQLLPDGQFSAVDGRPFDVPGGKWLMDATAFESLRTKAASRTNDFHFDYEHQTLHADDNGKPAPAAGWFKQMEYVPGEGLFALNVDWTQPAAAFIANKEYRYISAVFSYDTTTGRPLELLHAALTNDPALDGMKAIAALKANQDGQGSQSTQTQESPHQQEGTPTMNEALKVLFGLLGITEPDYTDVAALKAATDTAQTALAALKAKAERAGTLETELNQAQASVAALKADGAKGIDLSKFVPKETYDAQVTAYVALKAGSDKDSVEQLLKDNADKVLESEKSYLTDFGEQQGVAALKAMLEARPAIAALKTTQTQDKDAPNTNKDDLTPEQLAVCKNMGLSAEEFKASLPTQTQA